MKKAILPSIETEGGAMLRMEASGCAFLAVSGHECLFVVSDNGYLCRKNPDGSWSFQAIPIADPEALAVTYYGTLLIGAEGGTVYEYRPLPLGTGEIAAPTDAEWVLNGVSSDDNAGMEGMALFDRIGECYTKGLLVSVQGGQRLREYNLSPSWGREFMSGTFPPETPRKIADLHGVRDGTLLILTDDHRQGRYESTVRVVEVSGRRWTVKLPYAGAEGIAVSSKGEVVVVLDQNEHQMRQNGLEKNLLLQWESLGALKKGAGNKK